MIITTQDTLMDREIIKTFGIVRTLCITPKFS